MIHAFLSMFYGTLRRDAAGGKRTVVAGLVIAAAVLITMPAFAEPTSRPDDGEILAASETVLADRRLAAGYLRTGNLDLAALALERLKISLAGTREAALAQHALAATDAGDVAGAAARVEDLAVALADARRAAGRRVLADCVREASAVFHRLDRRRTAAPDLSVPAVREDIAEAAAEANAAFGRCDAEAPAAVKEDPDFRRLIDRAKSSLGEVPDAALAGDAGLLHRYLIELRALEQLLLFRFG